MEDMTYIPNIVNKLNRLRLGNKDKWIMGSITLVDLPSYETCTAKLKYKMYNTWVQILELETTIGNDTKRIRDSSPMGMKPTEFKKWLAKSIENLCKSQLAYEEVTNRLSANS